MFSVKIFSFQEIIYYKNNLANFWKNRKLFCKNPKIMDRIILMMRTEKNYIHKSCYSTLTGKCKLQILTQHYIISSDQYCKPKWDLNLGLQQPLNLNLSEDLNHSSTMAGKCLHFFLYPPSSGIAPCVGSAGTVHDAYT